MSSALTTDISGMETTIGAYISPSLDVHVCRTEARTKDELTALGSRLLTGVYSVYGTEAAAVFQTAWKCMAASSERGAAGLAFWCGDVAKQLRSAATLKGTGLGRGSMTGGGKEDYISNIFRGCDKNSSRALDFVSLVGSKSKAVDQNCEIRLMRERAAADLTLAANLVQENARGTDHEARRGHLGEAPTKVSLFWRIWGGLTSMAAPASDSASGRTWAGLGAGALGVSAVAAVAAWYLSSRGTDGTGTGTDIYGECTILPVLSGQ